MNNISRLVAAACAALLLTVAHPAAADPGDPAPTWIPDGDVDAVAIAGQTAYIGGSFGKIAPYTGGAVLLDPASAERRQWPDVAGRVRTAIPDGDGGWYLGGYFTAVDGEARENLAHVLADGSVDPAWAPTADSEVYSLVRNGDTVYAGGGFKNVNGLPRNAVAAVDAATGATASFGGEVGGPNTEIVRSLALGGTKADPILYVGGSFRTAGGATRSNLASFSLNGGSVTGFDPQVNGEIFALEVTQNQLYLAGEFTMVNTSVGRRRLAAVNPSSGTVTAWNPKLSDTARGVYDLAIDGSTVYATGHIGRVNVNTATEALRSNAAAFDATTAVATPWDPRLGDVGLSLAVVGQSVYLGGLFQSVNGLTVLRRHAAAVDKSSGAALPWNPGPHDLVALVVGGQNEVIVSGLFQAIGGVARRSVAAIDLRTGEPTAFDGGVDGHVTALAVGDDGLWVGDLTRVNGTMPRANLAQLDLATGQARPFAQPLDGNVRTLAADGPAVYVGGDFTKVGTSPRKHAGRLPRRPRHDRSAADLRPGRERSRARAHPCARKGVPGG